MVLIIGILASIAFPQYQKAVEKSRATQALAVLKTLVQAQESYYLANGNYARNFDELAMELPWTGSSKWITNAPTDTRSNSEWSLQIYRAVDANNNEDIALYMGHIKGPYKGAGFVYFLQSSRFTSKQLLCGERRVNGIVFEGEPDSYCKGIFGGTPTVNGNYLRMYTLPF